MVGLGAEFGEVGIPEGDCKEASPKDCLYVKTA